MNRELPDEVLRGQMYYADLDPVIGSEQGGNRPVLVIQNNIGNRHSPTIIIAPITTRVKKLHQPTHIGVPPYFGLPQNSMVMLEQIRTIDKSRLGSYVGCFDDDVMDYVDEALGISVGLHDLAGKEQKPYADESHDEMHGEMVLTLCGTCLRQFICSPEHIVRRINHAQAKEPCMYCHVRDGYDYRIIHKKNTWAMTGIKEARGMTDELMEQRMAELNARNTEKAPAFDSEKRAYSVDDIMAMLDISRSSAYILIKKNLFRSFKIGKQLRISKASFDEWLDKG